MDFDVDAEITGTDPERGIGVETYDRKDNYHYITIDWDGNIVDHEQHDYPLKMEDMSGEQTEIIEEVQDRAIYKAHLETDANFVHPNWDPRVIDRGIQALGTMSGERFAEEFADIYDAIHDPEEHAPVPVDQVLHFIKSFSLTPIDEIKDITPVTVQYLEGTNSYSTRDISYFDDPFVDIIMPPMEFPEPISYPEEFREFLQGHLIAQIRDIFYEMGQEPPERYLIDDMPGKPDVEVKEFGE